MKQLLSILLYVTGFIQGKFVEALKNMFNTETIRHLEKDDMGTPTINLDKLLTHLRNTFGSDMAQIYMFLMFLNIVKGRKLAEFFEKGYHGYKVEGGYANLYLILNFMDNHFGKLNFTDGKYAIALSDFKSILKAIPTGKYLGYKEIPCLHCTNGTTDEGLVCQICNGTGKVEQRVYVGKELNDDYINNMQNELQEIAADVATVLNDYIQYFITDYIYHNVFYVDHNRTGSDDVEYNGGSFTIPFYCQLRGEDKFPTKNINLVYQYFDTDFTIPVIITDENMVMEQSSRFKSELPNDADDDAPKSMSFEKTTTTIVEDGHISTSESTTHTYTKKNGLTVVGHNTPPKSWKRYYKGETTNDTALMYFNANDYTRDEVRQAYASLVGLPKYMINITTITL